MFNRYQYVGNNPVNMVDPDGKMGKELLQKLIKKIESIEVAPNFNPASAMDTAVSNSQLSGDVQKASVGYAVLASTAKGIVEAAPEVGAVMVVGATAAVAAELGALTVEAGGAGEIIAQIGAALGLGQEGAVFGQSGLGVSTKAGVANTGPYRIGFSAHGNKAVFRIGTPGSHKGVTLFSRNRLPTPKALK